MYDDPTPCSIFIDNSNIDIGARKIATVIEGPESRSALRLSYESLIRLASAGRPVKSGVCVGSTHGTAYIPGCAQPQVRRSLEARGIDVELYERCHTTDSEQAIDQAIQVHMLRTLADCPPGVAVLLSGDGAGYPRGRGFFADLERMHKRGWAIELLAWNNNCNRYMQDWARDHGQYIALDNYYYAVTFVKGRRGAVDAHLENRPVAQRPSIPAFDCRHTVLACV